MCSPNGAPNRLRRASAILDSLPIWGARLNFSFRAIVANDGKMRRAARMDRAGQLQAADNLEFVISAAFLGAGHFAAFIKIYFHCTVA